jgi:hypothetical protein
MRSIGKVGMCDASTIVWKHRARPPDSPTRTATRSSLPMKGREVTLALG